jgi:hypothetical protein
MKPFELAAGIKMPSVFARSRIGLWFIEGLYDALQGVSGPDEGDLQRRQGGTALRAYQAGRHAGGETLLQQEKEKVSSTYVYIRSEPGLWTVGFYDPAGKWHSDSDHDSREAAADRVHWLNGGQTRP